MSMTYFNYLHLPPRLQAVSKHFHDLAVRMDGLPEGPQKELGMTLLLQAKDAFVRAEMGTARNPIRK